MVQNRQGAVNRGSLTRFAWPSVAPSILTIVLKAAAYVLPTTDGREIRLRVATPTPEQQRLLDQLDVTIPTHLEWNAECSADFVAS
jgi:hypothetical protein